MDCLIISECERNAQFAGQLLVSLTGHLGTKTDLSGYRVYQASSDYQGKLTTSDFVPAASLMRQESDGFSQRITWTQENSASYCRPIIKSSLSAPHSRQKVFSGTVSPSLWELSVPARAIHFAVA